MGNAVEPGHKPRGSAVRLTVWGLVGAVVGGPAAVLFAIGLIFLYLLSWDPPGSSGYGNPHAGMDEAIIYGGIVFTLGAVLGAFVAAIMARRMMPVWGWGVMGAVIGGAGGLFLAVFLVELYVDLWGDPDWFHRYEVTFGQLQRPPMYFLFHGMVLMVSAALGALAGVRLGRRMKQRPIAVPPNAQELPRPASGWQGAERRTRRTNRD